MTKKQYRIPNVIVGTVKKSMAAIASRWFRKNVIQRRAGSGEFSRRAELGFNLSEPTVSRWRIEEEYSTDATSDSAQNPGCERYFNRGRFGAEFLGVIRWLVALQRSSTG